MEYNKIADDIRNNMRSRYFYYSDCGKAIFPCGNIDNRINESKTTSKTKRKREKKTNQQRKWLNARNGRWLHRNVMRFIRFKVMGFLSLSYEQTNTYMRQQ